MDPNQTNIETRYRTILTLWSAITTSVVIFAVMMIFVPSTASGNARLSLMLNCGGIVPLALSFLLKSQVLSKAVQQQRVDQVQVAYVLSFALSEMAGLLAVLDHFMNAGPYFYVGFIFAGLGMLSHFPQKKHLLAASGREF
jgi:hypothetical protein